MSIRDRLRKKRKTNTTSIRYIDNSFILGSVAEVERFRNLAVYTLRENRQKMKPQIIEALTFFK